MTLTVADRSNNPPQTRWRARRLFWRVYWHSLLLLLAVGVTTFVLRHLDSSGPSHRHARGMARHIASLCVFAEKDSRQALQEFCANLGLRVSCYSAAGELLAHGGAPLPPLKVRPHQGASGVPKWRTLGIHRALVTFAAPSEGYALVDDSAASPKHGGRAGIWFAAIVVVLALASIPLVRAIVRPLEALTAVARAVSGGDLSRRSSLMRKDEIGDLARALDAMVDRLQQRLRSDRELLANVSHELRTPLARIRVALELALEGSSEDVAREHLVGIQSDLSELDELIEDLLTSARLDLEAGNPAGLPVLKRGAVDLRALIEAAAATFSRRYPHVRLELVMPPEVAPADGDARLLRRAIDNLLNNAALHGGGSPVTLTLSAGTAAVEIDVADQGPGVAAEDLPHLFEPFFRAERSRNRDQGGVGLGLTLCRRIVEAHHGRIELRSQVGRGTSVCLRLPIEPTGEPDSGPPPQLDDTTR